MHSVAYDQCTVRAEGLLDAGHSVAVGLFATGNVHVCVRSRDVDSSVATGSPVWILLLFWFCLVKPFDSFFTPGLQLAIGTGPC